MKGLILFATLFAAVSAIPTIPDSEPTGWYVPTDDDKLEWISKEQYENASIPMEMRKNAKVQFYLFTKSNLNLPKQLYLNDKGTLSSSLYRSSWPTRIIIHGWKKDHTSNVNLKIRSALLNKGTYNVISVDWSDKSKSINYISARNAVANVGKQVAAFVDFLSTHAGMSFNDLTIIGHSLGAHVAGYAGKQVTRGKVNTIIGLDPAYPLFSYSDCSTRLCSSDAVYVESIQTKGNFLGFLKPIGKAAFYPNGGKSQPGCGIDLVGSCGHRRSYEYFAEAIERDNFRSIRCASYEDAVKKECGSTFSNVRMGTGYGNSGVFYVPVNNNSPYGTA